MTKIAATPGSDYREREKIKRRCERWVKRLQTMSQAERDYILQSLLASTTKNGGEDRQRKRKTKAKRTTKRKAGKKIVSRKSKVSKIGKRRKNRS
jgi:hypothetical protein